MQMHNYAGSYCCKNISADEQRAYLLKVHNKNLPG